MIPQQQDWYIFNRIFFRISPKYPYHFDKHFPPLPTAPNPAFQSLYLLTWASSLPSPLALTWASSPSPLPPHPGFHSFPHQPDFQFLPTPPPHLGFQSPLPSGLHMGFHSLPLCPLVQAFSPFPILPPLSHQGFQSLPTHHSGFKSFPPSHFGGFQFPPPPPI